MEFMDKLSSEVAAAAGLQVLYEDADLLLFEKPAGLLSVPGRGIDKQDCLSARAQARFSDALVVHRLDMATSGLLLMARGLQMQRRLSQAFARREVHKRYVAVVASRPDASADHGDGWSLIDLPILLDWPQRPLRKIDVVQGQASQTRWRLISHDATLDASRVELEPVTGRSHQLRVHLRALGHPILGDALYAPPDVQARAPRLLLHATELRFIHPATGLPLAFTSAPPF
jgi:tRNA pseudouridine32 synthase / 23S rRNA pseudouridine746 synthase